MSCAASAWSKSIEALISFKKGVRRLAEPAAPHLVAHRVLVRSGRYGRRATLARNDPDGGRRHRRGGRASSRSVYLTLAGQSNVADAACRASAPVRRGARAAVDGRGRRLHDRPQARKTRRARLHRRGRRADDAGRVRRARWRWSTSGRPGAARAARRCRRSTAWRRNSAARISRSCRSPIDTTEPDRPRQFLADVGATNLPLYTDPTTEIFEELKARSLAVGLPVTVLIDRNGCHLGHMNGPAEWDSEDGKRLIMKAIQTTPTTT